MPAAAILLTVAAAAPVAVLASPYGSYNEDWDGTNHLFDRSKADALVPYLTYEGNTVWLAHGRVANLYPGTDSVLLIGPSRVYKQQEAEDLRTFLQQGGRVLLADDTGTGGDLLADLNIGASLPKTPIFTPGYSKRPEFPIAFSTGGLPALPAQVILERPSIVEGDGQTILRAPDFTWLDRNGNGRPDLDEPRDAFPLAKLFQVGEGELLVLGDASLFTKEMSDANPGAVDALLEWLLEGERVLYMDESHRASADPMGIAPALSGNSPDWLEVLVLVLATSAVLVAAVRLRVRRKRPAARPRFLIAGRPATPTEVAVLSELEN